MNIQNKFLKYIQPAGEKMCITLYWSVSWCFALFVSRKTTYSAKKQINERLLRDWDG